MSNHTEHQQHDSAAGSLEDLAVELQARYAEAESLLSRARERAVIDHIAMQRTCAERDQLRAQLGELQDAYEQLALLVESAQPTASDEPSDEAATSASETE